VITAGPLGFDAERQRGASCDLTAFGRQIDLITLDLPDGGEIPGGVVTPEGFEPSIFALKGRRANRCTTGSLLGSNGRAAEFTAGERVLEENYAALGRLSVSARTRAASA
jgi:hypothetical protein